MIVFSRILPPAVAALVLGAVCLCACTSPSTTPAGTKENRTPAPVATAGASAVPLGKIALPLSSLPIAPAMEAEYREKFAAWLEERSQRRYRIQDQRLFTVKPGEFYWRRLSDAVGDTIKTAWPGGTEDRSWLQPDYFLVRGWRLPEQPEVTLILAFLDELPEKRGYLVGFYEVVDLLTVQERSQAAGSTSPASQ
jgi:hypothetical protein